MSWDETAVLVAVRGNRNYFDTTVGKIISYPDGSNGWDFSMQRDQFLVQKMPVSEIEKLLNDLIMHQPEKKINRRACFQIPIQLAIQRSTLNL